MNKQLQEIANRVISDMESGKFSWEVPYDSKLVLNTPKNLKTGKPYRGLNTLALLHPVLKGFFKNFYWVTFAQCKQLGGKVKKGSSGTKIFFWNKYITEKENGESEVKLVSRIYTVFNLDQCEGLEAPKIDTTLKWEEDERVSDLFKTHKVKLQYGGDSAFYDYLQDYIQLPEKHTFKSEDSFYQTKLHELTHWTGHSSRLNRELSQNKDKYAYEELIAEFGSAFLMAELGKPYSTQHAAYIKSWVSLLKKDKKKLISAISESQKIVDYLLGRETNENAD